MLRSWLRCCCCRKSAGLVYVFDTAARIDPGRKLLRVGRFLRTMPFVQHGREFARVAGSVTTRTDAQKMAANSVELAAWSWTIPRDNDAAFGKEIGPTVPLSQVKHRNQAQTPSRLLPKPFH